MDARVGVSTYHNEALSAGSGLNTATDVGIPGANLDDLHERHDRASTCRAISNPIVGFSTRCRGTAARRPTPRPSR